VVGVVGSLLTKLAVTVGKEGGKGIVPMVAYSNNNNNSSSSSSSSAARNAPWSLYPQVLVEAMLVTRPARTAAAAAAEEEEEDVRYPGNRLEAGVEEARKNAAGKEEQEEEEEEEEAGTPRKVRKRDSELAPAVAAVEGDNNNGVVHGRTGKEITEKKGKKRPVETTGTDHPRGWIKEEEMPPSRGGGAARRAAKHPN